MKPEEIWLGCARWARIALSEPAIDLLLRYRDWLRQEAISAGGIGPAEADRLERRHIGDSILFAGLIDLEVDQVWDVGSGVGLPGVPLAILHPDKWFALVDRSGRRAQLMRRAIRILDLENVEVRQEEASDIPHDLAAIVSRATIPPSSAIETLAPHLRRGGQMILGGSWVERPVHSGWQTIEIPPMILDQEVWLLMMRQP